MTGATLNTLHNLSFYLDTMRRIREAIAFGRFEDFRQSFHQTFSPPRVDFMTTTDPLFGMLLALGGAPGQQVSPLDPAHSVRARPRDLLFRDPAADAETGRRRSRRFSPRSRSATRSSPPAACSARSRRSARTPCNCRLLQTCGSTFPGPRSSATRDRRPLSTRRIHKSWRRTFVGKSSSFSVSSRWRSGRSIRPTRRCGSVST